eukprot:CAMPEP_0197519438 /NCGR_PEP_ID=MMETSP1318-20131121/4704_1 /TAXON_ID=552666 /ORGANISM="Partenskyella glossopodia, Strain RCC365" /LENGTH=241 /DNA_ID=CAMNT_0043070409 /DNA_START=165 /DNA_END=890 /DNA_ORIENTATION=-
MKGSTKIFDDDGASGGGQRVHIYGGAKGQNSRDVESVLFEDDDDSDAMSDEQIEEPRSRRKAAANMAIVDPNIDFLGTGVADRVVRGSDKKLKELNALAKNKQDSDIGIKMGDDGRLIIKDPSLDLDEEDMEQRQKGKGKQSANRNKIKGSKRRRGQQGPKNSRIHSGKRFKAGGGAGGDVKKMGVDPYAYVPMNPAHLNKRKHFRAKKAFETVVSAAKKGGRKGAKLRKMDQGRKNRHRR